MTGFYDGIQSLVPFSQWTPQQKQPVRSWKAASKMKNRINPMIIEAKSAQRDKIKPCYLDEEQTIPTPDVFAYSGIPANMPAPYLGDYEELGVRQDVCYERFGRFGSYGYTQDPDSSGAGSTTGTPSFDTEEREQSLKPINYRDVDWGKAQKLCYERNSHLYKDTDGSQVTSVSKGIARHAFVLRSWQGYNYTDAQMLSIRAMINELSLKSGGEYDVHLLVHIKDTSLPIWSSRETYAKVLELNVPRELWNITTLWSEDMLSAYYSADAFASVPTFQVNEQGPVTGVFRSGHWPMQWFSQENPGYDFFWNWEMDVRYTGHYYEFMNAVSSWSKKQPRKGLWERSSKFYIPSVHGSWNNFVALVENNRITAAQSPVWGPVEFNNTQGLLDYPEGVIPPTSYEMDNYEWGVDEAADLITFNPIFDVEQSTWLHGLDVTGYNTSLEPPPRRCSVVAITRMSKRLLDIMHGETWDKRHSMFPEVFPATIALHYGLKAVYPPVPVYLDRLWNAGWLDRVFNWPANAKQSVFSFFDDTELGFGEFNHLGSTFYFLAQFGGSLWRRWMGAEENGIGGTGWERENGGTICLRGTLIHPVKDDGV